MKKSFKGILYFSFAFMALLLLPVLSAKASITQGTVDATYKYAWGENIGWINFGATNGNVQITDSAISGHAWSSNYGWINLDPANSGVTNNGDGTLSGYAWGQNIGWINFTGVTINTSGEFSGTASTSAMGDIKFDCSGNACVKTDWRPRSVRPACNNALDDDSDGKTDYPADPGCSSLTDTDETDPSGGGGGGGGGSSFPSADSYLNGVSINNGALKTTQREVALNLSAGTQITQMTISSSSNFTGAVKIPFTSTQIWDLCQGAENCPNGTYSVYVRFYTAANLVSQLHTDSIIYEAPQPVIEPAEEEPEEETPIPAEPEARPELKPADIIFERDMAMWATGSDVKELQKFLNNNGFILSVNDVGAPGRETEYFFEYTRFSLRNFQETYQRFIGLSDEELTGLLDSKTRAFINSYFIPLDQRKPEPEAQPEPEPSVPAEPKAYALVSPTSLLQRDLTLWSKGQDVVVLQKFLNSNGFIIAESGIGSPGRESEYYGPLTRIALRNFQEAYPEETLAPSGLTQGNGLLGKSTRDFINSLYKEGSALAGRLSGMILLQVEKNGEAWHVYPVDKKRYYLGRPADAFEIMRKLGLGAKHEFIKQYTVYPERVSGRILIDVDEDGRAYYIYPKDKKAYYLGRPADAFRIMRELGLGIKDIDLDKILAGKL